MPLLVRSISFAVSAALLSACAVGPSPADEPTASTSEAMCTPPLVPLPPSGALSLTCTQSEAIAVSSPGYTTANCVGRAGTVIPIPSCTASTRRWFAQVSPQEAFKIPAASCTSAYMDYSAWARSRATGAWASLGSSRLYGWWVDNTCVLYTQGDVPAGSDEIEITADAYQVTTGPFGVHFTSAIDVQMGAEQWP
jgi:hypothetical protein